MQVGILLSDYLWCSLQVMNNKADVSVDPTGDGQLHRFLSVDRRFPNRLTLEL